MYSLKDLTQEIEELVEERRQCGGDLHPDWLTQEILSRHSDITGADADFYQCCARGEVRDAVRQRVNRYKAKPELSPDPQLVLDGFERLQERYLIEVDGVQVARLVHDMSHAQLSAKAAELRGMGAGCYQHADEIERYLSQRQIAA